MERGGEAEEKEKLLAQKSMSEELLNPGQKNRTKHPTICGQLSDPERGLIT